jgi:PEP-CTERM motif
VARLLLLLAFIGAVGFPATASADPITIVDTGPGPAFASDPSWLVDYNTAWAAAQFSTTSPVRITNVQGWIVPRGVDFLSGPLRINLMSNASDLPGAPLFSAFTNVPGIGQSTWYGQSGLSWNVAPGTYWLSFEALTRASFMMPGIPADRSGRAAFAVLQSECNFNDRACWPWQPGEAQFPGTGLAVQIFGESASGSPTPEPGSLLLLGGGMLGLMARRFTKRVWRA